MAAHDREVTQLFANLHTAVKRIATAVQERDRAIRALRRRGISLREVARAAGLSHTAVDNIATRPDEATPPSHRPRRVD